jgi:ubiquinone/menaquinone biosynthesis C-methylase UbiE
MDAVRFWDRMAAGYDAQAGGKYEKAYEATVALTRKYLKSTDAVLDFACGTGFATIQLAGSVASIHAVDISPKMIELARAKYAAQGAQNVTFAVATLKDASLPEASFDAVLAFNILHGLPDAPAHCARIHRLLKPDGLFISVTDCLKDAGWPTVMLVRALSALRIMPHVNILSQADVRGLVAEAGFTIRESQNLFETPPNLFVAAQKR